MGLLEFLRKIMIPAKNKVHKTQYKFRIVFSAAQWTVYFDGNEQLSNWDSSVVLHEATDNFLRAKVSFEIFQVHGYRFSWVSNGKIICIFFGIFVCL